MKKVINILIFVICVFIGINSVSAINYTEYKKGDLITIKLNDTNTMDFYVLSDSDGDSATVKAISKDVVGDKIKYSDIDSYITNTLKKDWKNVVTISIPSIDLLLGEIDSTEESFDFSKPDYAIISNEYWTYNATDFKNWIISKKEDGMGLITLSEEDLSSAYFRPVVIVKKEKIVNGTYITDEEFAWNNFVTLLKNEVSRYYNDSMDITVKVISDNSSIKLIYTRDSNTWETNYVYENGIISYVKPSTIDESIILDHFWSYEFISILSELKGYDFEEVELMLESTKEEDLNLKEYGIEIKTEEYKNVDDSGDVTVETKISYYSTFKLDLVNGFPVLENTNDSVNVDNPDTGNFSKVGIFVLIIVICSFSYIVLRKKSLFPKHN